MFWVIIYISFSIDVGIDFGSFFIKSAIGSDRGYPEIALNLQAKRHTPTLISFKNKINVSQDLAVNFNVNILDKYRVLIGDDAIQNQLIRPSLTSGYFPLFIDLNETQAVEFESLFKVNSTTSNIAIVDLLSLFFLNYLDSIAHDKKINSITVSVPAHFTIPQRLIIQNAFNNIGIHQIKIIDDIQAIINIYAVEKQKFFFNQEKQVMFIDIGASSIKSYVVKFNLARDMVSKALMPCATRLSYVIDTKHGGLFITKDIANFFKKKIISDITSKNASNFLNFSIKDEILIFNIAEDAKNQLTLVQTVPIDIEINNHHYKFNFTRIEFEKISKPTIQAAADIISEVAAGLAIDYVEVIGGSSRIPLQNDYLKEAVSANLYLKQLSKSLNADESIAIGAAYSACSSSKFKKYPLPSKTIEKFPIYSIKANEIQISKYNSTYLKTYNFGPVDNIIFKYNRKEFFYKLKTDEFAYEFANKDKKNVTAYFEQHPISIYYIDLCGKGNNSKLECQSLKIPLKSHFVKPNINIEKAINETNLQKKIIIMRGELVQYAIKVYNDFTQNNTLISMTDEKLLNEIHNITNETKDWLENISQICVYNESIIKLIKNKEDQIRSLIKPVFEYVKLNKTLSLSISNLKKTIDKASYYIFSEWPKNKVFLNESILNEFSILLNKTVKFYKYCMNLIQTKSQIEVYQILSNDKIVMLDKKMADKIKTINEIQPSYHYLMKKKLSNSFAHIKIIFASFLSKSPCNKSKKKNIQQYDL